MFDSIEQIKAHSFVGNAHSDMKAFMSIDAFVSSKQNTISQKAEALRIMSDKGMGCSRDEHISDTDIVQEYLDGQ